MRSAIALVLLLIASAAQAHRSSDAYLSLAVDGPAIDGHWEIALRDVAMLTDVDADGDRLLRWGELRQAEAALRAAVGAALTVAGDGSPCALEIGELQISDRSEGRYAWLPLRGSCTSAPASLALDYRLLFDLDPDHRGLLSLRAGDAAHAAVFDPERRTRSFPLAAPSHGRLFADYFREGVHHIWIGTDHVLFIVALLLPAVLIRRAGRWQPAPDLRLASWDVVRVVTAFTVAHSLTLGLSASGLVSVPVVWAEAAIALSVVLAAVNNLWPLLGGARAVVAGAFGLIHGFGFAAVLGELGLPQDARLLALLAFNLGVEGGQLAIVAAVMPLAWVLRHGAFYRRVVLTAGSLAVATVALVWLLQRIGLIEG